MAYKPIQVGQIDTAQVETYSAKPAEIVFDDQINKLHLGGTDTKLKGVRMAHEDAWATCVTAGSTVMKIANASEFALKTGARVAVKFTYANTTTAPTLNVNATGAIALKKPNGSAFTTIVAGGVYTFVYDGTNFIVQGEGGGYGTAVARDVRKGKTIGTEEGVVTGTLDLSNLIASNIKEGVIIDGVTGTLSLKSLGGKQSASGSFELEKTSGFRLSITNLTFKPSVIKFKLRNSYGTQLGMGTDESSRVIGTFFVNVNSVQIDFDCTMITNGFTFIANRANLQSIASPIDWVAYE